MSHSPSAFRQGEYVALAALPGRTYTYTAEEAARALAAWEEAGRPVPVAGEE